jgi:hypothetical protein
MAKSVDKAGLEMTVRRWMKENKKEGPRLEFKQRIEVNVPGAKAEFIRDVLSLANSDGAYPREDAYLVLGYRDGVRYDIQHEHYDGSVFSQILNSYVHPPVPFTYEEFGTKETGRFGVLTVRADANAVYVVNKELRDNKERLLSPGQSWGRNAGGKVNLSGEDICMRFAQVAERRVCEENRPLLARIAALESDSGPALDVKRIRFDIETSLSEGDWSDVMKNLQRLLPYAREFDYRIKHEVLDAVYSATANMRDMPSEVASVIGSIWEEIMPVWGRINIALTTGTKRERIKADSRRQKGRCLACGQRLPKRRQQTIPHACTRYLKNGVVSQTCRGSVLRVR